jgi:predicted  nucleic acid-binding Zn-ribbon protein
VKKIKYLVGKLIELEAQLQKARNTITLLEEDLAHADDCIKKYQKTSKEKSEKIEKLQNELHEATYKSDFQIFKEVSEKNADEILKDLKQKLNQ